jgi:pimeloyl-ACP methyl ester carboxylesterase
MRLRRKGRAASVLRMHPAPDPAPGVLDGARTHHLRVPLAGRPTLGVTMLAGTGEPLLWLHPNRTNRRVFDHAIAALATPRPVVVPELRGHGDSDRPAAGYALEDHLDDLLALADVLLPARFTIIGQATGATLALFLATRLPDRVARLALFNPALGLRASVNALVQRQVAAQASFASAGDAMDATPFSERWAEPVRRHWLATALEPAPGGRLAWRYHPPGVAETEAALVPDRWAEIAVACPTLLVRGAESDIITPAELDRAATHLPQATRAELPRANHRLSQDNPAGVAALVAQALADG